MLLVKLEVALLIRKFPASTELHGSFLCLQGSKLYPIMNHVSQFTPF